MPNAMGSNVTAAWKAHKKGAYFGNPCFTQIHPTCIPVMPYDFLYDGKDAATGEYKFSTLDLPAKSFAKRTFKAITNSTSTSPNSYYGLWGVWRPKGIVTNDTTVYLKIMLNLKRNNATATTQNILYVVTYPVKLKEGGYMQYWENITYPPYDTTLITPASATEVNSFCNGSVYVNYNTRFSSVYRDSVLLEQKLEKDGLTITPNPNRGQFVIKIKQQKAILNALQIIDASGRIVYKQQVGSLSLDNGYSKNLLLNLSSGIYSLQAITKKGILKSRFVIAK